MTLNRPERRNGLDVATCRALHERLREISASDARVVILRGAGDDFCVGADLRAAPDESSAAGLDELGPIYHAATLLHEMPRSQLQRSMAAVQERGRGATLRCSARSAAAASVTTSPAILLPYIPGH